MDNSTDKGEKENESLQELDLSALRDFNFASNWSEAPAAPVRRERDSAPRGGPRRDRHVDRRPAGARSHRSGSDEARSGNPPSHDPDRRPAGRFKRQGRPGRLEQPDERQHMVLLRESPFEIQVFPEEPILATLTKAMRQSIRTYELFEVARLILEKPDRFHVSLRFHGGGGSERSLFQSVPDGLPFVSEEAAIDHVFRSHLAQFFTVEEVEAEQPKGSFQFIARCSLTGDFLSPPNYHLYQSILLQYYQEHFPDMPFERFRSHIETVKDEEAIQKWLLSMTKQNRYKRIGANEGDEELSFSSPEEARAYLLQHKKAQVVRTVKAVRLPGKRMEEIVDPEIRPYVLAYAEHQQRFPLDTANTLRGRLRRQHFFIYKKGAKGISLVCSVKRKHRQPGQVFSETVQALLSFLEENDQIVASQLPTKLLGIPSTAEGEEAAPLEPEVEEKVRKLNLDLRWLLSEGYVTEYSDGRLSVHPVAEPEKAAKRPTSEKGNGPGPVAEPSPKENTESAEEPVVAEASVPEVGPGPTGMAEPEPTPQPEPEGDPEKSVESEEDVSSETSANSPSGSSVRS